MSDLQERARAWLRHVLDKTGLSANALAGRIDVSSSTLSRVLNDKKAKHVLSLPVIDAIERETGINFFTVASDQPVDQTNGPELELVDRKDIPAQHRIADAIKYVLGSDNSLSLFRVRTKAMEIANILKGDFIIVDESKAPKSGDIIIADVQMHKPGRVIRLYQEPYLLAVASDRVARMPILIEKSRVEIVGVYLCSFRAAPEHGSTMQ